MNLKWMAVAAAVLAGTSEARCKDYFMVPNGAWDSSGTAGRFEDGGTFTARMRADGRYELIVQCARKRLSISVLPQNAYVTTGSAYSIKFRVDRLTIFDMFGEGVENNSIVIDDGEPKLPQLVEEMLGGKELAMRITGRSVNEAVLRIDGADRAFVDIVQNCPLNKKDSVPPESAK
jgi:hypothetical protein